MEGETKLTARIEEALRDAEWTIYLGKMILELYQVVL